MKLTGQILAILFLGLILLSMVANYLGDFSYSSEGVYVSASECKAPESQEAILFCGQRHCLNIMQLDNLITPDSDIGLKKQSYASSSNPDRVEMLFLNNSNNKSIQCILDKASVVSVSYVSP